MNIHIHKNGQQHGPFSIQQVNAKVAAGEYVGSDPAWIEGWPDWRTLASVAGFVPSIQPPPFRGGAPSAIPPHVDASGKRLVVAGYVFAGLAFLILPLVFTIVGIALGVVNIIQARIGHGVAQIGLSIFCGICGTLIGGAGFGLH